jgi:hypothetical protein
LRISDRIYWFLESQQRRNKWVAVLRRMGVTIFSHAGEPMVGEPIITPDSVVPVRPANRVREAAADGQGAPITHSAPTVSTLRGR